MSSNIVKFPRRQDAQPVEISERHIVLTLGAKCADAALEAHAEVGNLTGDTPAQVIYLLASLMAKCEIMEVDFDELITAAKTEFKIA